MTDPRGRRDYFPFVLVLVLGSALFFLVLLDREAPLFSTPGGMAPFLFIVAAFAAVLAVYAARAPVYCQLGHKEPLLRWRYFGAFGGALTGLIYLGVYWGYDWPAANRSEISERQVNEMCNLAEPVPEALIIQTTPDPLTLIPGFMLVGLALGLVVGLLFPPWHARLERAPIAAWLKRPYPSAIAFGLTFGALIGSWLCPIIFSISDGRPFIRFSTSAIAIFLAVGFYLLFEAARHRHSLSREAFATLISLLLIASSLAGLVWFIDVQLELSAQAYCFFYDTWNTHTNELEPGWRPLVAGAGYGAMVGVITMALAVGFMVVRTAVAGHDS